VIPCHFTQIIDARGTETYYDDANHVIEVRTPRYFDTTDTEGYQKAKETWTYNGRGLVATHTEATGTSVGRPRRTGSRLVSLG
jgi:hypothetical protein